MKIYTKTGDNGQTSLFGGQRVGKHHARIEVYGTVDELNSVLGLAVASGADDMLLPILRKLQDDLFVLGADLATPPDKKTRMERITKNHFRYLESIIDDLDSRLEPLKSFILPGGSTTSAYLHLARTICRRAERHCVSCRQHEQISDEALIFLNRLSDLLFVMARFQNKSQRIDDVVWNPR